MQPALLLQFDSTLRRQKQQSPEDPDPVGVQIQGRTGMPALHQLFEIHPVQGVLPSLQKNTERRRGFR